MEIIIPIILAVVVFSVLILFMSAGLISARKKLLPQGDVKIKVNGEKTFEAKPGGTLLGVLSSQSVFLPSACGGGGTCAMCRCQVDAGGGDILPTELNHISRKDAQDNWRLACQVKVRGDMEIRVPEEIFGIQKWECTVVSNYNVASFIKEFVVRLPEGEEMNFDPGGYIQIDVPKITVDYKDMDIEAHPEHHGDDPNKFQEEWDTYKLWDLKMVNDEPQFRAYSMANHPAEGNIVMLNIRIATPPFKFKQVDGKRVWDGYQDINPGVCSSYIFNQKPGDKVVVSGPYGEFHIKPTKKEMVYIGGGAGMAPLRSHLFHLFHTLKTTDRKVSFWYGGRTRRELFYIEQFREIEKQFPNFRFYVALDNPLPEDNWQVKENIDAEGDGFRGFIMPVCYEQYLKNHPEPEEIEYYFCGPPMMNKSVVDTLDSLGVPEENISFDDFGG
ncbi:NADH:ubiquinone reductase (Na(+)-transporting) subunit F [Saprospira sp. CCB-QB6]|uniref:NADH:ubiquinone reductase (Na(+)-transporting) subunit F n=1 Tax=Saprospira sp. CCB-QB6 TaxID=3023936 RepID=UPI00234A92DF|nr:NADH:ubiquinone reductase (Na(+)-transporting) subunit F [Saprospira sp. CCB-QB6]WCL80626.1 NADH:ubiquinone reductase (Na(+)-transporting) subunit F [Saprospira sp. CCB-QB6]